MEEDKICIDVSNFDEETFKRLENIVNGMRDKQNIKTIEFEDGELCGDDFSMKVIQKILKKDIKEDPYMNIDDRIVDLIKDKRRS